MPSSHPASPATAAPVIPNANAGATPASYELALAELDRLVAQMESGQLPLDQLLEGYRRGAVLIGFCRSKLQVVEDQVKVLEDGQLKAWPGPAA